MLIKHANKAEAYYLCHSNQIDENLKGLDPSFQAEPVDKDNPELWSNSNWIWFTKVFLKQSKYHCLYYPEADKIHSKGVNVYALDMISAVEQFVSQYGIEPYYCMQK